MLKHYLPLTIVPLSLILWGLFGATQLTAYSFSAFVNYQSLYKERSAPGSAGEALSPQVVLVVVDGLRLDQSRQLTNFNHRLPPQSIKERYAFVSSSAGSRPNSRVLNR